MKGNPSKAVFSFAVLLAAALMPPAVAQIPAQLPDPDGKPADRTKPVKVFVLMGQSNMVGMGDISGGSSRWGKEFLDPIVSVYSGEYSPEADCDSLSPIKTMELQGGFWRPVEQSPRDQGYHYNRNADTYMLVGEALGRGMVGLLGREN